MAEKKTVNPVTLVFYLVAWYALNVQYNLYNKKILNVFPFPASCSLVQLGAGIFYVLPQWILGIGGRKFPYKVAVGTLILVACCHGAGHFATVISLGAGSVAFANVVKAAEPLFSVLMGVIFAGSFPSMGEGFSLLPIIAGVMIASMAEPEFSQTAFIFAMLSNVLFAARGTFAKKMMTKDVSGADGFAISTFLSFAIMTPVALYMEGDTVVQAWNKLPSGDTSVDWSALAKGDLSDKTQPTQVYFAAYLLVCGLYYYTYNEMAFMVLDILDPVGQAVGNTVKRVVIIIAGTIVFNKPLTTNGIIGSSVAIGGVLLYSIMKSSAGKKPAVAAKKTN